MKGYNMFNNKRAIESPEDMNGLKIRTSPVDLQVQLLEELGANPTPLAYGETFTALQQGTIDGIHIATGLGWTDKFYEASEYLTLTKHVALVHNVMINNDFYETLPDDLQAILDEELQVLIDTARENSVETNNQALEEIESSGIEVIELSDEQVENFKNASTETIDTAIELTGEDFYEEVSSLMEGE